MIRVKSNKLSNGTNGSRKALKTLYGFVLSAALILAALDPASSASSRVKITFWSWDNVANATVKLKSAFEAKHPNIELELVKLGNFDAHNKLSVALAAGSGAPDVSQLTLRRLSDYKTTGTLLDVTDRFREYEGKFVPFAFEGAKYQGRLYGLPLATNPGVILYRKDIFEQFNVKADDIRTWDDFIRAGKRISDEKAGRFMTFVSSPGAYSTDGWSLFLASMGGQVFDAQGRVIRDNKKAEESFKFLYDLVHVHKVARLEPYGRPSLWTLVKDNKIVTLPLATFAVGNLISQVPQQSGKWRAMPWPLWQASLEQLTGDWGSSVAVIPKQTKHPQEASQWVEFLAATQTGSQALYENGPPPAYLPSWDAPFINQGLEYLGGQVLINTIKVRQGARFNWYSWTEAQTVVGAELDAMLAGRKKPDQAWRDAERNLAAQVKR